MRLAIISSNFFSCRIICFCGFSSAAVLDPRLSAYFVMIVILGQVVYSVVCLPRCNCNDCRLHINVSKFVFICWNQILLEVSDVGDIYVAHYDFPDAAEDGRVVVLDSDVLMTLCWNC